MATIAVFLVLGGGAYAALQLPKNSVRSKHIVNGQVKVRDLASGAKKGAVTGAKVREESLTGKDFDETACPGGTRFYGGACIETDARPPTTGSGGIGTGGFNEATRTCAQTGRRLPTYSELEGFRDEPGITLSGSEITQELHDDSDGGIFPKYMAINDAGDRSNFSQSANNAFRCVATPLSP